VSLESLAEHRLTLARELLDDIELGGRLSPETLLLKASRLARAMEAPEMQTWLAFELKGYPLQELSPVGVELAKGVGRVIDPAKLTGYFQPYPQLLGIIRAWEMELQALKVPDVHFAPSSSNPQEYVAGVFGQHVQTAAGPVKAAIDRMAQLSLNISNVRGIVSKVVAALHEFVAATYYELAFRSLAEGIFEAHRKQIDALLAASAGEALQKMPAIAERLAAGDSEAVSNAMTTGRRVLLAFADAIQPPTSEKLPYGDQFIEAGPDKYLNRVRYAIKQRCTSERRERRLLQTLVHLNDCFGAGTHADISPEEARALFVALYVFLGEVLSLGAGPAGLEGAQAPVIKNT
jgi:hypothetical protein